MHAIDKACAKLEIYSNDDKSQTYRGDWYYYIL